MYIHTRALVLLAGLAMPAIALSPQVDLPPRAAAPAQVALEDLLGAEVILEVGTPEPTPPSGTGSTPGRAGLGTEASKGSVKELVLATQDGQIVCAALSVGGLLQRGERLVLVPTTAIQWTMGGKEPRCLLKMTKPEIEALPVFDMEKDGKEGLDRAVEQARGLAAGLSAAAQTYALSSRLEACEIHASDKKFAKVQKAAVDVAKYTVSYLLASYGGIEGAGETTHVVPFRACKWTSMDGKDVLKLGKTSDQLKAAPEYKKPAEGILTPEQMKTADRFFGGSPTGLEAVRGR